MDKNSKATDTQSDADIRQTAPLKPGVSSRNATGYSLDDVRIHFHSDNQDVSLQALTYTKGGETHIEPGQERLLTHEHGHVVQQKR
jgi:hypothetical protein